MQRCNTSRAFEDESQLRMRSSLEFRITQAQDQFGKQNSGM
jgi:hypothetical protein